MSHLTRTAVRTYPIHGVTFRSYASSATGARQPGAWRAGFAPNTPGHPHRMSREEILHVLEGSLEVDADDEHFVAEVGDAVLVPAQARLCVSNCTERPARA